MRRKISAHVDGDRAEGLACADPGAMTPSALAEITFGFHVNRFGNEMEDNFLAKLNQVLHSFNI